MPPVAILAIVLIGLAYAAHRTAQWADDHGWLYYRKESRAHAARIGVMTVLSIHHPQNLEVIDEIWEQRAQIEHDENGEKLR